MHKSELVATMAELAGTTQAVAGKLLDAFMTTVEETLKKGESVQINGFGSFEVKVRAEHDGINPLTKEKIHIAQSKTPSFKAAKALKEAINV